MDNETKFVLGIVMLCFAIFGVIFTAMILLPQDCYTLTTMNYTECKSEVEEAPIVEDDNSDVMVLPPVPVKVVFLLNDSQKQ